MNAEEHLKRLLDMLGEPTYNGAGTDYDDRPAVLAVFDYLQMPVKLLNEARQAAGLPPVDEDITP